MSAMFKPLEARVEEEIDRGLVSDVCFEVGQLKETKLYSSRATLALASPVFHAMFFAGHGHAEAPQIEGGQLGQRAHVAVTDVEPSALRCMLRYVHHLDPQLSLDNSLHVYRAADKYQIEGLLGACDAFIETTADVQDVDQVLRLFDMACRLGLDKYSARFLDELGNLSIVQTARLLRADEFCILHAASLATLLRSVSFCVEEEPLWWALRRWAELRTAGNRPELSPEGPENLTVARSPNERDWHGLERPTAWQDMLTPLKRLIRFPAMRACFFAEEVARTGVLAASEVVDILCHLSRSRGSSGGSGDRDPPEAFVAGFSAESRVPQLRWGAAPGAPDAMLDEESGVGVAAAVGAADAVVVDGRSLAIGPWGPRIVLGGSGSGFQLAFGSMGFSSGRHAWTITWTPLGASRNGARGPGGRGGAAGLAVEERPVERSNSGPALQGTSAASSIGGMLGTPLGTPTVAYPPQVMSPTAKSSAGPTAGATAPGNSTRSSSSAAASAAAAAAAKEGEQDLSARFIDWSTCCVFGVKPDAIAKRFDAAYDSRYVAWDPDPSDLSSESANLSVSFAIALDFPARTVTYLADRGERKWTAPLLADGRVVYPVIAASGAHYFHIQYGVHI